MTNQFFILHDLANNTEVKINGYDAYLEYFKEEIVPEGLGTRYMFQEVTKSKQTYHFRIVTERQGCIGGVPNRFAPKRVDT